MSAPSSLPWKIYIGTFSKETSIFSKSVCLYLGLHDACCLRADEKPGASFALLDEKNKDLYYTIKQNIIGGPTIIFNRHNEAGLFVRRCLENDFKPEKTEKYLLAYDWLDWISCCLGRTIQHKLNSGKEKKIGPYPVDDYDPQTLTVYQFHGCNWHGHRCRLTRSQNGKEKWEKTARTTARKTTESTHYLQRRCYTVVEMRVCTFRNQTRFISRLRGFLQTRRPPTPQRKVTESKVLTANMSGQLFGMAEVHIRVPEEWPSHFRHRSMSPHQYFQEMSPIFCTSEVPYDVIGSHMQEHVRDFDLSKNPRRLLVGGHER